MARLSNIDALNQFFTRFTEFNATVVKESVRVTNRLGQRYGLTNVNLAAQLRSDTLKETTSHRQRRVSVSGPGLILGLEVDVTVFYVERDGVFVHDRDEVRLRGDNRMLTGRTDLLRALERTVARHPS